MSALAIILQLAELAGSVLQATQKGVAIYRSIQAIRSSGREPTDADWQALDAALADLKAQLDTDPPVAPV